MALIASARLSLRTFLLGIGVILVPISEKIISWIFGSLPISSLCLILSYGLIIFLLLLIFLKGNPFQVAVRASGLGFVFGIGVLVCILAPETWTVFGLYTCLLSFFHFSEYFTTAIINAKTLSTDSFLINHSVGYGVAIVCSWVEYVLEHAVYSDMKLINPISFIGLLMCLSGEFVRKLAMFTARTNFNHIIQVQREEGHVLVTHGVYKYMRHPSYVGWFWWSIGTQLVLCNPICLVVYIIVSWLFFNERILEEEITLLNFFGEDYLEYQQRVPTGMPFIEGYKLEFNIFSKKQ